MWRSAIAAALGDGESAVALWRRAMAQGSQMLSILDSRWIAFESLRDYTPFQDPSNNAFFAYPPEIEMKS